MASKGVTIITGGGRGIGRAIAKKMAQETSVILVGRTERDLISVSREIKGNGGSALFVVGDVSHPETAHRTLELAKEHGFIVRNLICNAGIGKSGPVDSFDDVVWRNMFDINVHGSFYFIKACLPEMVHEKKGTICLMSSIAGVKGYAYTAAYAATKHALVGLARSLALEYGKHGIVAVPICPSFVESEMTTRTISGLMERKGISEEEARERVAGVNPQKRIIPAEEIAEAVAFVCSGTVPSLSGNPLILSGGE
ncbi:MAG: SDR family oxidoreductase [bacterium]|nr:SDR family oxidoreductase [bacterium]